MISGIKVQVLARVECKIESPLLKSCSVCMHVYVHKRTYICIETHWKVPIEECCGIYFSLILEIFQLSLQLERRNNFKLQESRVDGSSGIDLLQYESKWLLAG